MVKFSLKGGGVTGLLGLSSILSYFPTAQFGRSMKEAFSGFDIIEDLVEIVSANERSECENWAICRNHQYKHKSNILGSFLRYNFIPKSTFYCRFIFQPIGIQIQF